MNAGAAPAILRAGDTVAGIYRVEALLGQGGAAAVYRVLDQRDGRRLALKQLQAPDDERRALVASQFEREFHTLAQLAHPRIIEVYDYGVDAGAAYYTMELLDGEDLHERGRVPWRKACEVLCDVASSLAIIHSRGLVHRDVTARNVRCTGDGRAKLIDFGAMARVGVSHRLVGTPPFVPPEALQLQALDGRADLFGLGALAYFLLTGRYAYPAQSFNQLRDLWRTPVPSPRQFDPELPDALAELVLQLLQLERGERPGGAAEVMERLSGIAGLQLQELPQVGRAYLVMPTLVGRDDLLREVRASLLKVMQSGHGSTVLIEGEPGSGRSRFLDACVLEARLSGAVILRGDATDTARGAYAVARVIGTQLLQSAPQLAQQSAQPRLSLLSHVLPELALPSERAKNAPERRHVQAALRDWVLAIARSKHIVIAVDDVDTIDEPSAAWLGALAHGAQRRKLTLLLTATRQPAPSAAVSLLREVAQPAQMQPLSAAQTEALLRSLFGDVERLLQLAERVQATCSGNPRKIMALVEQLLTRGALRYEAGSWTLPIELNNAHLPASERDATLQRIAGLSPDARSLLDAVSLSDPSTLRLPDYVHLGDHGDAGRTFAALDELVTRGILAADGDRYRVTALDALEAARTGLDEERARTFHARLADVLSPQTDLIQRSLHLLRGGREREAIEELIAFGRRDPHVQDFEVFELAILAAERLRLPALAQVHLRSHLAIRSGMGGRYALFTRHAWPMLERLERDSGLLDCYELGPELGADARVRTAFARAQQRYDAAPETDRAFSPQLSLERILALYGACASMGALAQSLEILERPRSLEPWFGLMPMIKLMDDSLQIQVAWQRGRPEIAVMRRNALLESIKQLPAAVRQNGLVEQIRLAQVYGMGLGSAMAGSPATEAAMSDLEQFPGYRSHAWRVRMLYHLVLGNPSLARDCRRRAELLDLQDGQALMPGITLKPELIVHVATDDLLGVKRAIERLEPLAAAYPGWRPTLALARAHYRRLQGDPQGGLEALQPALEAVEPERHVDWSWVAETRLILLRDLGRHAEAAALGDELLETCVRRQMLADIGRLKRVQAEVLAQVGELERARRFADEGIAQREAMQIRGVMLGLAYETGARVAIAMRDEDALYRYAELCAKEFSTSQNPSASAKYERLMREAAAAGMVLAAHAPQSVDSDEAAQNAARTVYSRMLTCITPAERSERGLQLLLEATGASTGHLFGLRSGQLRWLSSGDQTQPSDALVRSLETYLRQQLDSETEAAPRIDLAAAALESFIDDWGRELQPLMLRGKHNGEAMIAGVAVLHFEDDEPPPTRTPMLEALIDALISGDIVDPITCVA